VPGGKFIQIEVRVGDARVMLADEFPDARVDQPLQDRFWGDRHGQLIDPVGHRWGIAQHLREVPPEEVTRAAAAMFGGDVS
jgi:PhnB protein